MTRAKPFCSTENKTQTLFQSPVVIQGTPTAATQMPFRSQTTRLSTTSASTSSGPAVDPEHAAPFLHVAGSFSVSKFWSKRYVLE